MKKNTIALALLLASQFAHAASTDWKCVSDCSKAGYQWGYCMKICSF